MFIVQWILSNIIAWSLMGGTPIDQVRRPINYGLIKDLILFPALSPFQRSTDSNGNIRSLIRPWLIGLRTWLIGVPPIGLPGVILLKIHCTINNPTQLLSQTINNNECYYEIVHLLVLITCTCPAAKETFMISHTSEVTIIITHIMHIFFRDESANLLTYYIE